jgi:hypothetical protein
VKSPLQEYKMGLTIVLSQTPSIYLKNARWRGAILSALAQIVKKIPLLVWKNNHAFGPVAE